MPLRSTTLRKTPLPKAEPPSYLLPPPTKQNYLTLTLISPHTNNPYPSTADCCSSKPAVQPSFARILLQRGEFVAAEGTKFCLLKEQKVQKKRQPFLPIHFERGTDHYTPGEAIWVRIRDELTPGPRGDPSTWVELKKLIFCSF